MIQNERVRPLNNETARNREFIIYWMQASQRTHYNHALEYAIGQANERGKPLLVFFGLTDLYPEANARHYAFLLEGLRDVQRSLAGRGIAFVVGRGSPDAGVVELSRRACLVVVDRGYVRIERQWRRAAAEKADCPLVQVETNAVVPLEQASAKEEYSARTIRPKIWKQAAKYLVPLKAQRLKKECLGQRLDSFDLADTEGALLRMEVDRSVAPARDFRGGQAAAHKRLREFTEKKLASYPEMRNDPNADGVSHLSPYLHFGQISPLFVALEVLRQKNRGSEAFLEELLVRRELSLNFVYYNEHYKDFLGLPRWARETLREHTKDTREAVYSEAELEQGRTTDPYWNAAQREMVVTGKMHGYMRMYWGKRLIEWTRTPEEAFRTALRLNNKYELDGRDANGFAGVAWCFGKHDRAWPGRPVFGKVRPMTASGLRRKFDADAYARKYEVKHG